MIHVLVAGLSGVTLQVVIEAISKQPDIILVGQVQTQLELLLNVDTSIDVVILGVDDATLPPGISTHLLNEFPRLKILALSTTQNTAAIYWLGIRHQPVNVASTGELVHGIRHAAQLMPTL